MRKWLACSHSQRIVNILVDATNSGRNSVTHSDEYITVFTPRSTPRIFYDPVVSVNGMPAPANCENSVINSSATVCRNHTRRILLESALIGFDSDRDWLHHNGRLDCCVCSANLNVGIGLIGLSERSGGVGDFLQRAWAGKTAIRSEGVVHRLHYWIRHHVIPNPVVPATVATIISIKL